MKTLRVTMFAAALQGLAAMTVAQEDITSSLVPTDDGRGVAACVRVSFSDLRELPAKAVQGLWALIVCVTQPIHPYHYVRDAEGKVVTDSEGGNEKVWFPFYRLWGERQGDSVAGIVYDNRGTNGIAGSHWFAGYGGSGWEDKAGKLAGLALLAWGTSEAFQSKCHEHGELESSTGVQFTDVAEHGNGRPEPPRHKPEPEPQPEPSPEPEPGIIGSDGEGNPVGR